MALLRVDGLHRNGYASSKASNLRRARAARSAPGACTYRPTHSAAARCGEAGQGPARLAHPSRKIASVLAWPSRARKATTGWSFFRPAPPYTTTGLSHQQSLDQARS